MYIYLVNDGSLGGMTRRGLGVGHDMMDSRRASPIVGFIGIVWWRQIFVVCYL
jgi:hypothetical protein